MTFKIIYLIQFAQKGSLQANPAEKDSSDFKNISLSKWCDYHMCSLCGVFI